MSSSFQRDDILYVIDDAETRSLFRMRYGSYFGPFKFLGWDLTGNLKLDNGAGNLRIVPPYYFEKPAPSIPEEIKPGAYVTLEGVRHKVRILAVNAELGEVSLMGYGRRPINDIKT